ISGKLPSSGDRVGDAAQAPGGDEPNVTQRQPVRHVVQRDGFLTLQTVIILRAIVTRTGSEEAIGADAEALRPGVVCQKLQSSREAALPPGLQGVVSRGADAVYMADWAVLRVRPARLDVAWPRRHVIRTVAIPGQPCSFVPHVSHRQHRVERQRSLNGD